MAAAQLAGIIFLSPDPERLAAFYREVFGLPFEVEQHGVLREHLECEAGGIHFAILRKRERTAGGSIVPSFAISNLETFLDDLTHRGIKPLHPILDIGDGKRLSSITDPDGNTVRLIQVG